LRQENRWVGVPTLDGLAAQVSPTPYLICPMLDARKGEVYTRLLSAMKGISVGAAFGLPGDPSEVLSEKSRRKRSSIGDGVKTYGVYLEKPFPLSPCFRPLPPSPSRINGGEIGA